MRTDYVGYAYLADLEGVKAVEPDIMSKVMSVHSKQRIGDIIAIPPSLKPDDSVLAHVLFALKHEGINLQILAQACLLINEPELRYAFESSPTGKYLRSACFLWEHFTGLKINRADDLKRGNYHPLFDPDQYITTKGYRNTRWRITFNGLGSLDYCITVRRTDRLEQALQRNILIKTQEFTDSLDPEMLNRTLT